MLVRLIPELGKYAMNSSMAMLLFLIVLVMVVAKKDEQKVCNDVQVAATFNITHGQLVEDMQ